MKKKQKRLIWLLLVILLIVIMVTGIIVYKNKDKNKQPEQQQETEQDNLSLIDMNNTENAKVEGGVKENTSEQVLKERKLENLTITDIKLAAQEGVTRFTATVENNTSSDFEGGVAVIKFTNKDGSEYATLEVYVPEIKKGGRNSINAGTTADIANAYDFTIELQK